MTDWRDANHTITSHDVFTPNRGPENGHYDYVWRAEWPATDNSYTWTYFLKYDNDGIVGFLMNDVLRGNTPEGSSTDDPRYYVTNGWPSNIPFSGLSKPLPEMGTVLTHDHVIGGKHDDWIFLGPGNDRIDGSGGEDALYGGSHDDLIYGGAGHDKIYGDYADAPVVLHQNFGNQVFTWQLPTNADPNVIDGNDILHGGDGSETIFGGGGNDQLDGGPRGKGWTDYLEGGPGADSFFLNYQTDANEAGSEEEDFWSAVAEDWVLDGAKKSTAKIVDSLAEAAAEDFFSSLSGGLLLGGFASGVESLAVNGLKSLFFKTPPAPPPPTSEDVMVIGDFDPREDTLVLPIELGKTVTATPTYYATSAYHGITNSWGIAFQHVDPSTNAVTNFAEVFLSKDFLEAAFKDEEGTTQDMPDVTDQHDADIPAFFTQIMSQSIRIGSDGIENPQVSYPFPTDPDAYEDGEVPDEASNQLELQSAEGATLQIYGAFGPLSIVDPAIGSTFPTVVGSNMGDIINVNGTFFAPSEATTSHLTSIGVVIKGFDGDDIIFAGNGQDFVYGGDGNDTIYGIGQSGVETREIFRGGSGDDRILLGWTSTWALVDGGDGIDTLDFTYLDPINFSGLTLDLSTTTASGSSTNLHTNFISRYDVENFENVVGSPGVDVIAGNDGDNSISGGDGDDTLAGGAGNDVLKGDTGDDVLEGGPGADSLAGNEGADWYVGPQSDWVDDSLRISAIDILRIVGRTQTVTLDSVSGDWSYVGFGDGTTFRFEPADDTTTFDTLTQIIADGDLLLLGSNVTYDPDDLGIHMVTIIGSTGHDVLLPGDGDDDLYGDPFHLGALSSGKGGNDVLSAVEHGNDMFGDAVVLRGNGAGGNDILDVIGGMIGTPNHLFGDAGEMSGNARGGDDVLSAAGDANLLYGDAGGGMSNNARGGDDVLSAAGDANLLYGDAGGNMSNNSRGGNDVLSATGSGNELYGDAGGDMSSNARGGNDTLEVVGDGNLLIGDASHMLGNARGGDDSLSATGNDNVLHGDALSMSGNARGGNDLLVGGIGGDLLVGDALLMSGGNAKGGNDQLWGDPQGAASGGADSFAFAGAFGKDVVNDFRQSDGDQIQLSGYGAALTIDDVLDNVSVLGSNTVIDIGAALGGPARANIITLRGFTDELNESDFLITT
ncbi:MAG: calcium-binding protein [Alphaproteobacteria bacterium]